LIKAEKAILIGFSLGGMICRRFAQDYPSKTDAMVILNSPYKRDEKAQSAILNRLKQLEDYGPQATVEDALIRWFSDEYRKHNPEMLNLIRSWVMKNDPEVYPKIYEVLASGLDEITAPTPEISCPVLVITADEDFGNGPKMSEAIASEIPNSNLIILNGLRHMALAEAPKVVNEPINDFLNQITNDRLINED
jgi:pimeloyl-ACP methyl ester carboxylesterase